MGKVLTTAATVICGHGATAVLGGGAKLTVDGNPVLLESDAPSWSFDALCSQKDTSKSQVQCVKVASLTAGRSTKLTVGGRKVLLESLGGTTNGAPKNTDLKATDAGQGKLEAP